MSPSCIILDKYSHNSQKIHNFPASVRLLSDAKKSRPAMLQNGILDAFIPLYAPKVLLYKNQVNIMRSSKDWGDDAVCS